MEKTNIFKVRLRTVDDKLLEQFNQKESSYSSYKNNNAPYETIEIYVKRRLEEFFEFYMDDDSMWCDFEDILVYWDGKNNYAYEIITGIQIPLFFTCEHKNTITNKMQNERRRFNGLFCYNYSTILNNGHFGVLNCYYIDRFDSPKLNFKASKDLRHLRDYINSPNHQVEKFTKELEQNLVQARKLMNNKITEMVKSIELESKNYEEKYPLTEQYQSDMESITYGLLEGLRYQQHIAKEPVVKAKKWWEFRRHKNIDSK